MSLEVFPNETLYQVVKDLDSKDLNALLCTNKFFARLLAPQLNRLANQDVGGAPALCWAADRQHEPLVRLLLKQGADVNIHDYSNYQGETTALHQAALRGNEAIVKLLLENGADTECKVFMESTALHLAARSGQESMTRVLLENGANPNAGSRFQTTPLQMAIVSRRDLEYWLLLKQPHQTMCPAMKEKVRQQTEEKVVAVVRTLLKHGASTQTIDVDGNSTLHLSISHADKWEEFTTIPRLLIEHGAETGVLDKHGWTELHTAIYRGHATSIAFLLERYTNLENPAERTPLYLAVQLGNIGIVESLLEKGANIEARSSRGRTLLHQAVLNNSYSRYDGPPLYHAEMTGQTKLALVNLLLERGAQCDTQDLGGRTALHHAVLSEDPVTVGLLLGGKVKANLHIQDHKGRQPIHYAAQVGCKSIIAMLLDKGALFHVRDVKGCTPSDLSAAGAPGIVD